MVWWVAGGVLVDGWWAVLVVSEMRVGGACVLHGQSQLASLACLGM